MTLLEALERFISAIPLDEKFARDVIDLTVGATDGSDLWAEAMTAAVSLSGMLDDAATDEDLIEGVRHFSTLLDAGVVSGDEWTRETQVVMDALEEFAERAK